MYLKEDWIWSNTFPVYSTCELHVILVLGAYCLEHMTFVFPTFILSPFTTNPSISLV